MSTYLLVGALIACLGGLCFTLESSSSHSNDCLPLCPPADNGVRIDSNATLALDLSASRSPNSSTNASHAVPPAQNCTHDPAKACKDHSKSKNPHSGSGIEVAKWDFKRVQTPYIICLWVLLGSLAKVGFHYSGKLSSVIPESCLLILLGILIGLILRGIGVKQSDVSFSSDTFFLFLLPPIILDAGYFMPTRAFYLNIGTILLYATIGTIFNTFTMGVSLYAVNAATNFELSLLHALLFGSFIAAVDPVAVLAVFEEVHVHEVLYILVFGESVLNDAASVVLYHTFEALASTQIDAKQVALAIVSFFVVSLGGMTIGIAWGIATGFVTRFTEHVQVIEPIFVFIMAYVAYLSAEVFHFSGIMSILFCGMVMKPYVESNVSRKSHTTIKYFMKLLSSACETIIFMFLGVSLIVDNHYWDTKFVAFTLLFMLLFRIVGVILLTGMANTCGRLTKINRVEQFIMSYGGLRGAVSFCLALLVHVESEKMKQMFVTATMTVVLFTVFIQGTTIKPLVRMLNVKRNEKRETKMMEQLNDRMLEHLVAGVEEVLGHRGHSFWREKLEYLNKRYLRYWLERDPEAALDEEIIQTHRRLAFKNALLLADNPSQFFTKEDEWECVKRNPSYAFNLAVRQHSEQHDDGVQPTLDTGVLSGRQEGETSNAFVHYNVASLIPKAKRSSIVRRRGRERAGSKYSLEALDEDEGMDAMAERYMKIKRSALAHMAPSSSRRHSRRHKHRHHRRHEYAGHSRKPDVETVPEVTEDEADAARMSLKSKQMSMDEDQGISFTTRTEKRTPEPQETFELNPFTDYYTHDEEDAEPLYPARRDSGVRYSHPDAEPHQPLLGSMSPVGSPVTDPHLTRDISIDLSASLDDEIRMHAFSGQDEEHRA